MSDWQKILQYLEPKPPLYCPETPSMTQKVFLRTNSIEALFGGSAGGGKGIGINNIVWTPFGPKKVGDIKVGDQLVNPQGGASKVIAVYKRGIQPCYKVEFSDGASIVTDSDHLWQYRLSGKLIKRDIDWKIATTPQLGDFLNQALTQQANNQRPNWPLIPLTEPINFTITSRNPDARWPIDPYTLGVLLGDGSMTNRSTTFASADQEIVQRVSDWCNTKGFTINSNGITHRIVTGQIGPKKSSLMQALEKLDVRHRAENKKVPEAYMMAPLNVRQGVIQGLMDTDGYVDERGHASFTSVSKELAKNVQWIARSLGFKASITQKIGKYRNTQGDIVECQTAYLVTFSGRNPAQLFHLKRKKDRCVEPQQTGIRRVVSVERVPDQETVCFTIDHPNGLFVAGEDFIVTHNSSALLMAALQYPLDVDTPVPTTTGWSTIGEIQPGDFVFSENGQPVRVAAKTDRFIGECYEIEFGNGERIVADANHLWAVHSFQDRMAEGGSWFPTKRDLQLRTTAELAATLLTNHKKRTTNWSVPTIAEIDLPEIDLPFDPYLLGVWLGDGCHSSGTIAGIDSEIRQAFNDSGYITKQYSDYHFHVAGLVSEIKALGLFKNKRVPDAYMRGSSQQRLALLQGLMDTDGTVNQYGACRFFNTNENLVNAVYEIVASLGATPRSGKQTYTTPSGKKKTGLYVDWASPFIAFRLQRKAAKQVLRSPRERTIRSITRVADRPVQCLVVDSPSSLFAVGRSFILTHNCDIPNYSAIIFRRTYADLALPGAIMDRFQTWIAPFDDVRWNSNNYIATFPSGARITFGYLNNSQDYLRYKGCLASGTEVLTQNGWEKIENIKVGTSVASMNPENRSWDYQPVTHTWTYDHDGLLYGPRPGSDVAFAATDNHNWWTSTQKRSELKKLRTDQLPKVARFPQAANFIGGMEPGSALFPSGESGPIRGAVVFSAEDWATFLGWYIAEGSTSGETVNIALHDNHSRIHKDALVDLLERSGAHVEDKPRYLRVHNTKLASWLNDNTGKGAYSKRIPDEVFTWKTKYARLLLQSLVEGDGTWRSVSSAHYVTVSRKLADDVMRLAQHCGFRATLDERHEVTTTPDGNKHEVCAFHVYLLHKVGNDTGISLSIDNKPIVQTHYKGTVHCLTVPPNHTFLIRYNGRVVWTGNSEFQYIGMDEVTEIRESDYRYLFSRLRRPASGPLAKVPLRMRAASNPAPNWVRQRFIVEGKQAGRIFVPSRLTDNPGIDADSYRQSLQALDPVERRRLEFGDWWSTSLGTLFERENFILIDPLEVPEVSNNARVVRFWDLAATEPSHSNPDPDWTVGTLMLFDQGVAYVLDVRKARVKGEKVEQLVAQTAYEDGPRVAIRFEQEPGSSGKIVADQYARYVVPGYDFAAIRSTGDKVTRSRPFAAAVANGNVRVVRGPWLTDWLDEFASFPEASNHDDQVDSAVGAFTFLTGLGLPQRKRAAILL